MRDKMNGITKMELKCHDFAQTKICFLCFKTLLCCAVLCGAVKNVDYLFCRSAGQCRSIGSFIFLFDATRSHLIRVVIASIQLKHLLNRYHLKYAAHIFHIDATIQLPPICHSFWSRFRLPPIFFEINNILIFAIIVNECHRLNSFLVCLIIFNCCFFSSKSMH